MESAAACPITERGTVKAISFIGGNRSKAMVILHTTGKVTRGISN
jgi:hypothetical protein